MTTTMAALPFMGGTLSGFDPSDSGCTESKTAGTYDSTQATCSLTCGTSPSTATSPKWPSAATFWGRLFNVVTGIPSAHLNWNAVQYLRSGVTVAQIRIQFQAGDPINTFHFYFDTLQSGVMTNIYNFARLPTLNPFDFKIVAGGSGSAACYSNNTLLFQSGTLNHGGFDGIDQMILTGGSANGPTQFFFSEICCDTSSTVGRRIRYDRLNTNSATNTGWTGGVTNINEIPTTDTSPLTAASANLVSTFYESGLNLGTDVILARGVSARMRTESDVGPQNIQMAIRSGSANFFSASIAADAGYQASFNSWTTDPNTSANWTDSAAASAESGVKSIT